MHEHDKSWGANEDRSHEDRAKMAPSCFFSIFFEFVLCGVSPLSLITHDGSSGIWNCVVLRSRRFTRTDYIQHAPEVLKHDSLSLAVSSEENKHWGSGAQCRN